MVAVEMAETPRVADEDRVTVTALSERIARVALRFGFMESANVPEGLQVAVARSQIAPCNLAQLTYFTGHETIIATTHQSGMAAGAKRCSRS